MATLELCDLCNGKVMRQFVHVTIEGMVENYKGKLPDPPPGFVYAPDETPGAKLFKVWDSMGRIVSETRYMEKPTKWKAMRIKYDLCEQCAPRLINILEALRKRYHLEQKKIELLEPEYRSPFLSLGYNDEEED